MADNPYTVRVVNPLEALMSGQQGYEKMRGYGDERAKKLARQQAEQTLLQGGDMRSALARLIGAGDVQGANSLANYGNQSADQAYKSGMLDIARTNATRRETPAQVQLLESAGIDPKSPEGRKALFPRTDTPISATDKKAIFEAEDALPQLTGTKEALSRALDLNDKTHIGYFAGLKGDVGTKMPGGGMVFDKDKSLATSEWSKIMGPEALQAMASTLKGATTDFELRKFIEMLGDPSTEPSIRAGVIKRMMALTDRKMQLQQSRVKDLRGGDYFKPGGGQPAPATQSPAPAAQSFQNGMRARNPKTGETIEFKDGQWVPAQ